MNYLKQSISFFELQLSNPISSNAQALYYILLNINNKCGWKERFTVANTILTAYTGLNLSALQRARNELIQGGFIEYKKGNGNRAGEYLLCKLYTDFEQQTDNNVNNKPTAIRQQAAQQTDTLYKQNKTKQDETKLNIKKENKEKKISAKNSPERKFPHGNYAHVLLTEEEFSSLCSEYANADELITFLDEYIEMKDYKVKSCYLAIKKWVVDAVNERNSKKTGILNNFKQPEPDYKAVEAILWERQKNL